MNYKKIVSNIEKETKDYIIKNKIESLILGISGGIDSAVVAVLASKICEDIGIPLIGRSLPIESNKLDEIERARNIGRLFCDDFKEIELTTPYLNFVSQTPEISSLYFSGNILDIQNRIRLGNIKARIRMIYLYDLASKYKGMVLSTDNYTEYLLGFWTLHGDHADYGMIQTLWKTEVYKLAEYLESEINKTNLLQSGYLRQCIDAVPTDGLGISNSDLDQMGASSYNEVDEILKQWIINPKEELKDNPVIQRHLNSEFKRKWPIIIPRNKLLFNFTDIGPIFSDNINC